MRGPTHRRGVRVRLAALAVAAVALLAGCGGGGGSSGHTVATRSLTGSTARTAGLSTQACGPGAQAPRKQGLSPTERKLIAGLERQFKLAGRGTGAYVYDLTTGRQLFALRD